MSKRNDQSWRKTRVRVPETRATPTATIKLVPFDAERDRRAACYDDLTLMVAGFAAKVLRWEPFSANDGTGELCCFGLRHATKLDERGCPIITPGVRGDLFKWRGFPGATP